MGLPRLPERLIVLGAGRSGVEAAQIYAHLGCVVTIVDGDAPLRGFDPELAAPVLDRLRRDGVILLGHRTVSRVRPNGGGLMLTVAGAGGEEDLPAGHLIVATGRRPAVEGIGLDLARIRCESHGIAVAADGRTSNPKVFAVGDVAGRGRSLAAAEAQAGVVLRAALFRQRPAFDPRRVPRLLETVPGIAVVGLTGTEARARHGAVGVWRWPLAETESARAEGGAVGHVKMVTTRAGHVVGAGIVGPGAAEAIGLWTLAISQGLHSRDVAALALPGSAAMEASRRAAVQATLGRLNKTWIARALRVSRWLG